MADGVCTVTRPRGRCWSWPARAALDRDSDRAGRPAGRASSPSSRPRQRMSTVHLLPSGRYEVLTKGSPEAILRSARASGSTRRPVRLERRTRSATSSPRGLPGRRGLRVLALARREIDGEVPDDRRRSREGDGVPRAGRDGRPGSPGGPRGDRPLPAGRDPGGHGHRAITRPPPLSVARQAGLAAHTVMLGSELPAATTRSPTLLEHARGRCSPASPPSRSSASPRRSRREARWWP